MTTEVLSHIAFNEHGRAVIRGSRIRVDLIAQELAGGWDVAEIQRQHPHLTLGQIHGALAHYYDNKEAFDREIAATLAEDLRLWEEQKDSSLNVRLRALRDAPS